MTKEFIHTPSAHCETGTVSNLLRSYGLEMSEPMVFGLASGMTFAYLKQGEDGYCELLDRKTMKCSIYNDRPKKCREYKTEKCSKIRILK